MDSSSNHAQHATATEISRLLPSTPVLDKKVKKATKEKKGGKVDAVGDLDGANKEIKMGRSSSVGGKISAKFRSLGRSSKSRRSESIKSNASNGSDLSVFNAAELMVGRSISVSTLPGDKIRDSSVPSSPSTLLSKANELQHENKNRWSSFSVPPEKPQRLPSFVDETFTKNLLEKEEFSEILLPNGSAVDENHDEQQLHSTIHQSPSTLPLPRSPIEEQTKNLQQSMDEDVRSRCPLCFCFGI